MAEGSTEKRAPEQVAAYAYRWMACMRVVDILPGETISVGEGNGKERRSFCDMHEELVALHADLKGRKDEGVDFANLFALASGALLSVERTLVVLAAIPRIERCSLLEDARPGVFFNVPPALSKGERKTFVDGMRARHPGTLAIPKVSAPVADALSGLASQYHPGLSRAIGKFRLARKALMLLAREHAPREPKKPKS